MAISQKKKILIIAAPNGAQSAPEILPYLPITPEEVAEEALKCKQAGAALVHIHARDPKSRLVSADIEEHAKAVKRIKEKCGDMLIQITGAMGGHIDPATKKWGRPTEEEKLLLMDVTPKPDAMPLVMGSMDMVNREGWATVFSTPDFLKKVITGTIKRKIKLEMEIWDTSFLQNAIRLAEEGVFDRNMPIWLHFCLGDGNGVQASSPQQLFHLVNEGKRLFPQAKWQVTARAKNYWQMIALSLILGCDIVRVGLEDHFHLPSGEMAKSTVQLVETAVRFIKDLGGDVATPREAREILSLPK
jgi:3-keto-5-aminohexanoate cleavage enzyme